MIDGIQERLRDNTDDLIARNGFGSPTWFVNGTDMYFGNDRMPLLEAAIVRDGARHRKGEGAHA